MTHNDKIWVQISLQTRYNLTEYAKNLSYEQKKVVKPHDIAIEAMDIGIREMLKKRGWPQKEETEHAKTIVLDEKQ